MVVVVVEGAMEVKIVGGHYRGLLGPQVGSGSGGGGLHHWVYSANLWEGGEEVVMAEEEEEGEGGNSTSTSTSTTTTTTITTMAHYKTITLVAGDLLYLPPHDVITWRYTPPPTTTTTTTTALIFSYVDASNLHTVKSSLSLEAHINDHARVVLQGLSGGGGGSSSSGGGGVDTTMVRMPEDLPWGVFTTWPRGGGGGEESSSSVGGGGGGGGSNTTTAAGRRRARGPRGGSGGGGSSSTTFKGWQMQKKWDQMVLEMTLPTPSPPAVTSVGRTNVTVEWTTAFRKKKEDEAVVGYEITWTSSDGSSSSNSSVVVVDDDMAPKVVAVNEPLVAEGVPVWTFKKTITGEEEWW